MSQITDRSQSPDQQNQTHASSGCSSPSSLNTTTMTMSSSILETRMPIKIKTYQSYTKFRRPTKQVFDKLQPIAYAFWNQYVDQNLSSCSSFLIMPSMLDDVAGIYVGVPNPDTLSLPSHFNGTPLFVYKNRVRRVHTFRDYYKNPLAPGASISPEDSKTQGTLGGMIMIDQEPHGITNWHVAPPAADVQNPSAILLKRLARTQANFEQERAAVDDLLFGYATEFGYSGKIDNGQTLDYSLIKLNNRAITNDVFNEAGVRQFCIDRPHFDLNSPDVARALFASETEFGKIGASTGYTYGKLYADTPTCIVLPEDCHKSEFSSSPLNQRQKTSFEFLFYDESGEEDFVFAKGGDSGAIVYVDGLSRIGNAEGRYSAVALLWSSSEYPPIVSVATPFSSIMKHLAINNPGHTFEFPSS